MVSIALVDARKTSLTGVQNSTKKIGSPLRGSLGQTPPPPWKKARSAPGFHSFEHEFPQQNELYLNMTLK